MLEAGFGKEIVEVAEPEATETETKAEKKKVKKKSQEGGGGSDLHHKMTAEQLRPKPLHASLKNVIFEACGDFASTCAACRQAAPRCSAWLDPPVFYPVEYGLF